MKILFWKSGSTVKHSLTLSKSQPGSYVRELRTGGWKVKVLDDNGKTNTVLSDDA